MTPTRPRRPVPAPRAARRGHAWPPRALAAAAAAAPWVLTFLLLTGGEPSASGGPPAPARAPFALEREVADAVRAADGQGPRVAQVDIDPTGVSVAAATAGSPRAFRRAGVLPGARAALRALAGRERDACVASMTLRHRRDGTLTWFVRGRRAGEDRAWTVDVASGRLRGGPASAPVRAAWCGAPVLG